MTTMWFSN